MLINLSIILCLPSQRRGIHQEFWPRLFPLIHISLATTENITIKEIFQSKTFVWLKTNKPQWEKFKKYKLLLSFFLLHHLPKRRRKEKLGVMIIMIPITRCRIILGICGSLTSSFIIFLQLWPTFLPLY